MSLNERPSSDRIQIAFFGKRNVGKSSLVNAIASQELSIVSDIKGTTTDPVSKAMELLPLGPVVLIDTPGYDDKGALGKLRIKRTLKILDKTDIAVLVADINKGLTSVDYNFIESFKAKEIPFIIVLNKSDTAISEMQLLENSIAVSAKNRTNIHELKEHIARLIKPDAKKTRLVGDLIKKDDIIVLVTPIDEGAPKGRIILPQQQTIRDILDTEAISVTVQPDQLGFTLRNLNKKPSLVICDSQVFDKVNKIVPNDIPLTSFSILMARYKGFLNFALQGAYSINALKNGDNVLICEGCTHHRQCGDIGSVKLPKLLKNFTGKDLKIKNVSGTDFPEDLSPYSLILHCGGCMITDREIKERQKLAKSQGIPMTNYGVAIAYMNGILERSTEIFKIKGDSNDIK